MQKQVEIKTNCKLSPDVLDHFRIHGFKVKCEVVEFQQPEDFGRPFKGYPNKNANETWQQWEERCRKDYGIDPGTLEFSDVVIPEYTRYVSQTERLAADYNKRLKELGQPYCNFLQ